MGSRVDDTGKIARSGCWRRIVQKYGEELPNLDIVVRQSSTYLCLDVFCFAGRRYTSCNALDSLLNTSERGRPVLRRVCEMTLFTTASFSDSTGRSQYSAGPVFQCDLTCSISARVAQTMRPLSAFLCATSCRIGRSWSAVGIGSTSRDHCPSCSPYDGFC